MCLTDAHAYSALPYLFGCAGAAVLMLLGLLMRQKFVRIPAAAWLMLPVAGYYLTRSFMSYAYMESLRDCSLILGCVVFYFAGIYAGQRQGGRAVAFLVTALLLNLAAFAVMRMPEARVCWLGRPEVSLTGPNSPHISLFLYKNFAALFFAAAGSVLIWRAIWKSGRTMRDTLLFLLGAAGIAASFFCQSRALWLVLPAAAVVGWILWLLMRLYRSDGIGMGTVLTGVAIITALGIGGYSLFLDRGLETLFADVDTHLRTQIWGDLCGILPRVPLWGCGAGASQWEIVPIFHEWATPNYAHNEYLQAWVDYGIIGLGLMLAAAAVHLICGFLHLASEDIPTSRRAGIATAWLIVVLLMVVSLTDFVWHDFSFASLTAFCCGILVSPCPPARRTVSRRSHGNAPIPAVRAQKLPGKCLLGMLCCATIGGMSFIGSKLAPAWAAQWGYDALVARHAGADERRAYLADVMQVYPDPAIMDHYVTLPYNYLPDWKDTEKLLKTALESNPRQMFTVVMLADILGRQGKCREAEALLRRSYIGDGMRERSLTNWPSYYSGNLLQWAQQELTAGNAGRARSIFNYAFRIGRFSPCTLWRSGQKTWTEGGSSRRREFISASRLDRDTLNALGVEEDHSWKEPLEPGGKPALYRRWGEATK